MSRGRKTRFVGRKFSKVSNFLFTVQCENLSCQDKRGYLRTYPAEEVYLGFYKDVHHL